MCVAWGRACPSPLPVPPELKAIAYADQTRQRISTVRSLKSTGIKTNRGKQSCLPTQGKATAGSQPEFDTEESAQELHQLRSTCLPAPRSSISKVVVHLPIPEMAACSDKEMSALYTKNLVSPNRREKCSMLWGRHPKITPALQGGKKRKKKKKKAWRFDF